MTLSPKDSGYRVGVDTGGTFTDLVLCDPTGTLVATHKLASTPADPSVAVLSGIEALLAKHAKHGGLLLTLRDVAVTHGSTVATNALLQAVDARNDEAGEGTMRNDTLRRVVFVTTAGFEDLLFLGRQHRPELYAKVPRRPSPPVLRSRCVGVTERMGFDGEAIVPLSDEALIACVARVLSMRPVPGAVAVCLLHASANPHHEKRLTAALRDALAAAGQSDVAVTASHELLPVPREFERSAACVINAAVGPAMRGYLGRLGQSCGGGLRVMGSHGGTLTAREAIAEPVRTILSGPAGGVAGVVGLLRDALGGDEPARLITLDMGGTSTDVCLIAGTPSLSTDHEAAGLPVAMPMVDVHAVGAGGGSIAWVDAGGALRVGPRSAGADPGPACYCRQRATRDSRTDDRATDGWWPTVTDAHIVLGRLDSAAGVGGLTLSSDDAQDAIAALAQRLGLTSHETALGIIDAAEAAMARAVQRVSLQRGHDPRSFTLVAFGGAGGLHACGVADRLGMSRVLVPCGPGLLCATGMLAAPGRRTAECGLRLELPPCPDDTARQTFLHALTAVRDRLQRAANDAPLDTAQSPDAPAVSFTLEARYAGQTHTLTLDAHAALRADDPCAALRERFHAAHAQRFGWQRHDQPIVCISARRIEDRPAPQQQLAFTDADARRGSFVPGDRFVGPLNIAEPTGTVHVPPHWQGRVAHAGTLALERPQTPVTTTNLAQNPTTTIDPIELTVFAELFAAAAEEMGEMLMRCASSPNITERLDHSCAVFDATGAMIAQAAHIPVHLGSSPASVRAVIDAFPPAGMNPGDRFFLNDPFAGGTHLPDVTVVRPVFLQGQSTPQLFVAARAHHADVGGDEPGSMGLSTHIDQEGVRLPPTRWTDAALHDFAHATRTPDERKLDLLAQAAAVDAGSQRLTELARTHSTQRLLAAAQALLQHAQRLTAAALAQLPPGTHTYRDVLDDDGSTPPTPGNPPHTNLTIACTLTVTPDAPPRFDFSDSHDQVPGPLNAVRSIVDSAVLYALRLWCGTELPNNSGILHAVHIHTRPGSIVDAQPPAPVAGGNVETSQRLVDVILGTLEAAAPGSCPADSCGSMNNVIIGSRDDATQPFTYYETLAGGAGAHARSSGGAGGDAVHTHMTNTRNTPIETLEARFPLRITRYALADHSAGHGASPGGRGVIRHYQFLKPARLTLLLERRTHAPRGRCGGHNAQPGSQALQHPDGCTSPLPAKCTLNVQPGDTLILQTPGGAGWGTP